MLRGWKWGPGARIPRRRNGWPRPESTASSSTGSGSWIRRAPVRRPRNRGYASRVAARRTVDVVVRRIEVQEGRRLLVSLTGTPDPAAELVLRREGVPDRRAALRPAPDGASAREAEI